MSASLESLVKKNKKRHKLSLAGFTLIECLISILVITIVMLGGVIFYTFSNESLKSATHKLIATEIASAQLEAIRNSGNPGLWPGLTNVTIAGLAGQQEINVTDISETFNGTSVNYSKVKVTIGWSEPGKTAPDEVSLDTYMKP